MIMLCGSKLPCKFHDAILHWWPCSCGDLCAWSLFAIFCLLFLCPWPCMRACTVFWSDDFSMVLSFSGMMFWLMIFIGSCVISACATYLRISPDVCSTSASGLLGCHLYLWGSGWCRKMYAVSSICMPQSSVLTWCTVSSIFHLSFLLS